MPTSTATVMVSYNGSKVAKLPIMARKNGVSTKNTTATSTLRSLYKRAAKAFLQRDMVLTYSLITSAFSNLHSPTSLIPDLLSSQRRKWDVLRITLEATLYNSNSSSLNSLPESLQTTLRLSPPSAIATMHTRSLQLFTPSTYSLPTAEFLPSQILVSLALASVKLECPQVGREIVEDWLHRRSRPSEDLSQDPKLTAEVLEGYAKVIEVYCLYLLPRLGEWCYIRDFLGYERELLEERRMLLLREVERLHSEYVAGIDRQRQRVPTVSLDPSSLSSSASSSRTATPILPQPSSTSDSDRIPSPSPSVTSTSTTSTHTAVPTRRINGVPSVYSSTSPTPRARSPAHPLPPPSTTNSTASTVQRPTRVVSPHVVGPSSIQSSKISSRSISQPSLITLIKSILLPHLTRSKISFFVIMCFVSLASYLFRIRRKRLRILHSAGSSTPRSITSRAGDLREAKRRLGGTGLWDSAKRAILDAARMAAGGLA